MNYEVGIDEPSAIGFGDFQNLRRHGLRSASFSEHELGIDVSLGWGCASTSIAMSTKGAEVPSEAD